MACRQTGWIALTTIADSRYTLSERFVKMNTRQISFAIQGMRGARTNCAVTLERALTRLDGVIAAHVNYATERATITYDPARVSAKAMVRVAQSEGFDVPRQRIVLNVADLIYASSARTVERVLARVDGVVQVAADLHAQQIMLDVLAEHVNHTDYSNAITSLGLRVIDRSVQNARRSFVLHTLAIVALALLSLVSAGAHAGLFEAGILHAPLVVMTTSVIAAYGIAGRFYCLAFDAVLRGTFDVSIMIALVASASLFLGLLVALLAPTRGFVSVGFIVTILLTIGWFIVRAVTVFAQAPAWLHQLAPQPTLGLIAEPNDANPQAK